MKRFAVLVLGSSIACSASPMDFIPFEELDRNGDGTILEDEAARVANLDFARADKNRDGQISRQEYEELRGRMMTAWLGSKHLPDATGIRA
jgi:hypothetical protein